MGNNIDNLYELIDKNLHTLKIKKYQKGDVAEGVVLKVTPSFILVKIDDVFDAIVPSGEIVRDEKKISEGSKLRVFIMKPEDEYGVMLVSQKRTTASQRWELLEEAYKNDEAVIVTVVEANSGGLIVNIDGVLGFIPTSLLDPNKVYKTGGPEFGGKDEMHKDVSKKLAELVGKKIKVKIMEIDREKSKVIFSEKLLLAEQPSELRQQTIQNVKIGDILEATVTAVTNYGIFVNAEGLDGLIHVSEISWDKVENPAKYASVGDKVKVKLIDISEDGRRVAYSIKQLSEDPWREIVSEFKVGGKVRGQIIGIEEYGLIVKIGQGVTGLIHKSELGDENISDKKEHFKVGDEVEAVILTIAPNERKIGLSIKRLNGGGVKTMTKKSRGKSNTGQKKVSGSLDVAGALAKAVVGLEKGPEEKASKDKDA